MNSSGLKAVFIVCLLIFSCTGENEKPDTINQPSKNRFGVDGLNLNHLNTIAQIRDSVSGINGVDWQMLEPEAPVGNDHQYTFPPMIKELKQQMATIGRDLQLNFRFSSDWALVRDPDRMIMDPSGVEAPWNNIRETGI